jgi:hypothetical protein
VSHEDDREIQRKSFNGLTMVFFGCLVDSGARGCLKMMMKEREVGRWTWKRGRSRDTIPSPFLSLARGGGNPR